MKASDPMTPPTIEAVGNGCDAGFPNDSIDADEVTVLDDPPNTVDPIVDDLLLREGIDNNVANDGVYVM